MKKVFIGILWAACGYLNYGYTLGDFSHHYPDQENIPPAIGMAVTGPFGTLVVGGMTGFKHWQTKPYTTEQRWEFFHQMFPELDREYFERTNN